MRILKQDNKQGFVRLVVEDADDLWDLHSVIEAGDHVTSSSERKINLGGSEEKTRIIKKRVTLTICVDKVTYDTTLRILGTITHGPDDIPKGSAHSFSVEEGTELTIQKEWTKYQLKRLRDATKPRGNLVVVLFDREQALFLNVTSRGVEELTKITGAVNKKAVDESVKNTFYKELLTLAQEYDSRLKPAAIVFASPAFWQEYLKKQLPEALKKAVFTTISDVEKTAVKELLSRPELQAVLKQNRAAQELILIEQAMTALSHEQLAYGDEDVRAAIAQANVKEVLLSEKRMFREREEETFMTTEALLRQAESAGANIHIITSGDACEKLDGLGGLIAIKRWQQ